MRAVSPRLALFLCIFAALSFFELYGEDACPPALSDCFQPQQEEYDEDGYPIPVPGSKMKPKKGKEFTPEQYVKVLERWEFSNSRPAKHGVSP